MYRKLACMEVANADCSTNTCPSPASQIASEPYLNAKSRLDNDYALLALQDRVRVKAGDKT